MKNFGEKEFQFSESNQRLINFPPLAIFMQESIYLTFCPFRNNDIFSNKELWRIVKDPVDQI